MGKIFYKTQDGTVVGISATPTSNTVVSKGGDTMTGKFNTVASTITTAGISIPVGTAPTTPVDGDIWATINGLYYQSNSVTQHVPRVTVSSTAPASPVDGDLWVDTSTPVWIAPTLGNSWVDYGGGQEPSGYYKDSNGVVRLRGAIKSGTTNTTVFTLPVGYRPPYPCQYITSAYPGYAYITIGATGTVTVPAYGNSGTNAEVRLSGITFTTF